MPPEAWWAATCTTPEEARPEAWRLAVEVVRAALGDDHAGAAVSVSRSEAGPPVAVVQVAAGAAPPPAVHVSLSHSGPWALAAASTGVPVGCDVEVVREPREVLAIAERSLPPEEAAALAALEGDELAEAFTSAWVRAEARAKALGWGVARLREAAAAGPWSVSHLPLEAGLGGGPAAAGGAPPAVAALAARCAEVQVHAVPPVGTERPWTSSSSSC